jgi:NAD(P)-dependent dehydrogenase (short-subunit alcohol dehydrogenase family)/acyl carrier protein
MRPSPEPPPASSQGAPDLAAELIRIASERTGYPPDMLQLDASIEADLGIDSIKRVEILSALQRQLPAGQQAAVREVMEKLSRARTFGEILSTIADRVPSEPEAATTPTEVDVKGDLIRIASERTGYPPDMLQLDASIEADLGIDSIKRVEILGALQRQLPEGRQAAMRGVMEKLTRARTLGEIVHHISQIESVAKAPADKPGDPLPTFRLALREISSQLTTPRYQPGRTCVITDDETGLAERLAASLIRAGEKVVLLRHAEEALPPSDSCVVADLTEPTSTEAALETVRRLHGPIGAILHLLPLRADLQQPAQDLATWRKSVRLMVRSLYLIVRAAQGDLERRGSAGEALITVVTGRGGSFGLDQSAPAAAPLQFAVADFAKALALELPDVICQIIDVDPTEPAAILNQKLLDELTSLDRILQVGRPADRRLTLIAEAMPPEPANGQIGRDWVIVLTGGARGITSQVARAIAAGNRPALILVGASRLPERPESDDTAGISDTSRLKAILLARLRATNPAVRAVDVETACQRLLRDREILHTIDDLKAAGSNVEYHALDVRDEAALSQFLGGVYSRHGRLDVFIHGAGIIEDRLIRDKTPDSFDRVVHTKSDSAYVLTRLLRPEKLRRLVFMSSISAAFGNRGQADYAAANGILNGLAVCADPHWQGKIVAMNWGPWDQGGMVTEDIRRQFISRGVQLISPRDGAEAVIREIARETAEECMPILGGGPWANGAFPAGAETAARVLTAQAPV